MKVRRRSSVRTRSEPFGGIIYVHHRNDFYAVSQPVFRLVEGAYRWIEPTTEQSEFLESLFHVGILEARQEGDRVQLEKSWSDPGLIDLREVPSVSEPLVVNCFCTAFCPLMCRYCHAWDTMQANRGAEDEPQIGYVAEMAKQVNAMVAVITGGDPLSRPERARRLIEAIGTSKSIVLDTSGVEERAGAWEQLLPTLLAYDVHVRVSLDSISDVSGRVRIPNPTFVSSKTIVRECAERSIVLCAERGLNVTVQTVISHLNDSLDELRDLRDYLIGLNVKNWVLHIAVEAGMARDVQRAYRKGGKIRGGILPSSKVHNHVRTLLRESRSAPIDIRCTDTNLARNSVLLIASNGDLVYEGHVTPGKHVISRAGEAVPRPFPWHLIDASGHAARYLNWLPWLHTSGGATGRINRPQQLPKPLE